MRTVLAICPRDVDGNPCSDEQEVKVEKVWKGGWCALFELPNTCAYGHVWTAEEKQEIQYHVTERALEPREP